MKVKIKQKINPKDLVELEKKLLTPQELKLINFFKSKRNTKRILGNRLVLDLE